MVPEAQDALRRLYIAGTRARRSINTIAEHFPFFPPDIREIRAKRAEDVGAALLHELAEYKEHNRTDTLEQKLTRFETMQRLLLHDDVRALMLGTVRELHSQGFTDFALIPLGSGALGGMYFRDLAGRFPTREQDVDLLLHSSTKGYDSFPLHIAVIRIMNGGYLHDPSIPSGFVPDKHGLLNAEKTTEQMLPDDDTLMKSLLSYRVGENRKNDEYIEAMTHCFAVSFPEEYGEKERRRILGLLQKLYGQSPRQWHKVISSMKGTFNRIGDANIVREKYLHEAFDTDRSDFTDKLNQALQEVRLHVFDNLLRATGPKRKKSR